MTARAERRPRRGGAGLAALLVVVLLISGAVVVLRRAAAGGGDRLGDRLAVETGTVRGSASGTLDATPADSTTVDVRSLLPRARLSAPVRVALVRETATDRHYGDGDILDGSVAAWDGALRAMGASVRTTTSAEVAGLRDVDLLIVPAAVCASPALVAALPAALARGAGVLLTGRAMAREGDCRHDTFRVLIELAGASRVDTLEARPSDYVTLLGATPLAAGIPPGARIEVASTANIAVRGVPRDGYWSDVELDPLPAGGKSLLDGAVLRAAAGPGRLVYWGFDLPAVVDRDWDRAIAALLARNSVAWAAGTPLAALEAWPDGRASAAVVSQDVEYLYANAGRVVDSLRRIGAPATFFLVTNEARSMPALTRALDAHGEIGSHTVDHASLGDAPVADQMARLEAAQHELAALVGAPPRGMRPPREDYTDRTLAAWARLGGEYIFGTANLRTVAPELVHVNGDTLVLLGRAFPDDIGPLHDAGRVSAPRLERVYRDGMAKVAALGGVAMVSFHSQIGARAEIVGAVARVARSLAADSTVWLATAGDVATWWRARATARVHVEPRGAGTLVVTLDNAGGDSLLAPVVRVDLPRHSRARSAHGATLLRVEGEVARLRFDTVPAGARRLATLRVVTGGASAP